MCVLCRSCVVLQYPTISSQKSQSIDPRLPGERANNLLLLPPQGAGVPPERIVKVQIDVQAVDEELPVSWVNAHGLAEVLKE